MTRTARLALGCLLVLALTPIATSLVLFEAGTWTDQLRVVPAAVGLSAPRYPWSQRSRRVQRSEESSPPVALEQFLRQITDEDPAEQARLVHGLALIFRNRWDAGGEPVTLIWTSRLNPLGTGILDESNDLLRFMPRLMAALRELPHDDPMIAEVEAGTIAPLLSEGSLRLAGLPATGGAADPAVRSDPTLWSALSRATRILGEQNTSGAHVQLSVGWGGFGRGIAANLWASLQSRARIERVAGPEYGAAIEQLMRSPVQDLEQPLADRTESVWRRLGLSADMARLAARGAHSPAAFVVARQVALHLEMLKALSSEALNRNDLEQAARWVELWDGTAGVLSESVRSGNTYNYILTQRKTAQANAQLIERHAKCPEEIRLRMVAISTRPAALLRGWSASDSIVIAFFLDNTARGCLQAAAVLLLAALVGAANLRSYSRRIVGRELGRAAGVASEPVRTGVAAAVAATVALAILIAVEAANHLGERVASVLNTFVYFVALVAMIGWFGWQIAEHFVAEVPEHDRRFRRRLIWMIGCTVMLAAMRPMIGSTRRPPSTQAWVQYLDSLGTGVGISPLMRLFLGGLLIAAALFYAFLVYRGERASAAISPTRPLAIASVALWVGLWIIIGPPGAWAFGQSLDRFDGQWSPLIEQVDYVSAVYFRAPILPMNSLVRGWNLLTFTMAVRMIHWGVWMIWSCMVVWWLVVCGPQRLRQAFASTPSWVAEADSRVIWLAGVSWSCLWLGLVSLAIHGWCTLGLGYCINLAVKNV